MHRGFDDTIYYIRSDFGNSGDSLIGAKVNFYQDELKLSRFTIPGPFSGEVIAFELDPLNNYFDPKL